MNIMDEMEQELLDELVLLFPNQSKVKIDNVQKFDGADTETFGFRFVTVEKSLNVTTNEGFPIQEKRLIKTKLLPEPFNTFVGCMFPQHGNCRISGYQPLKHKNHKSYADQCRDNRKYPSKYISKQRTPPVSSHRKEGRLTPLLFSIRMT